MTLDKFKPFGTYMGVAMSESSPIQTDETIIVRHTATWVVEVPRKETLTGSWDVFDVRDAVALCDGCKWTWNVVDPDDISFDDSSSLKVWKEYRDGTKTR